MAKDDMRVIMYKILRYLYLCNKNSVTPRFEDMCHNCKLYNISHEYWMQIMLELMDLGYVKGFSKFTGKMEGITITPTDAARITLAGVDFLEENSTMKKIGEHLGGAFELLLSSII